ncbi:hypothetical protein SCL_1218 [Sulfuricaulis limicola]|uniref:Capsule polysaccharide biosynthesis protein n=1 Tax=Sulfuricaulis limicola TaxID=1620215 RepID=A0A1B4XFF2_9GAMM|nr:hypothetical protein [Sulfuricaulis limicola]BAV33531.1 hypothetical protein SCL_1218 [Sulfuricaulis limicola]
MRAIVRYLWSLAKEALFLAKVWSPRTAHDVDESISEFIAANETRWPTRESRRKGILIEGHLSQYGPNYLLRTAVAARAIHEKTGLDIDVVFNGYSHQWILARKVYRSFGINNWVHLGSYFFVPNFMFFIFSRLRAIGYALKLKSPEDILKIRFDGIKVGDLIYDDVIRDTKRKTIFRIDRDVIKAVAKSLFFYFQYRAFFRKRTYDYFISTHTAYSEYGLLCRVALMHGVKVIETSDIQMSFYDRISNDFLPTYHDGIKNSIQASINSRQAGLDKLCAEAKESLRQRLDSEIGQIDAKKAYCGRVYARAELGQTLGLGHGDKIVFILAHVFSDAPHLSSAMLHADYYQWLASTLNVCAKSTNVHWVVKPHPSSVIYGENGLVEKMTADVKSDNVHICPADLNTKSLSLCADALVTVHGTAGLEYSCLGIPVVLAGRPFYSGFGFTIEPGSIADYERCLLDIHNVGRLSDAQVKTALEVYAIWNQQFDWHNPIITSDVLANVWGSGVPRDLTKAYRLITENIRVTDPRKLKLWEFVQGVVE